MEVTRIDSVMLFSDEREGYLSELSEKFTLLKNEASNLLGDLGFLANDPCTLPSVFLFKAGIVSDVYTESTSLYCELLLSAKLSLVVPTLLQELGEIQDKLKKLCKAFIKVAHSRVVP